MDLSLLKEILTNNTSLAKTFVFLNTVCSEEFKCVYLLNRTAFKGIKIRQSDVNAWLTYFFKQRTRVILELPPNPTQWDVGMKRVWDEQWRNARGGNEEYSLWDETDEIECVETVENIPLGYIIEIEDGFITKGDL